jgi:hypothetical protein
MRLKQRELAGLTQTYLQNLGGRSANPALFGPESTRTVNDAVELGVEMWAEGSLSMHAMCSERGIEYLHVLQPTLHDAGSKPMTEQEETNARLGGLLLEGARLGYPMLRKMGEVLRSRGVNFLDGTKVFKDVGDPLYTDACHFNEQGNVILADLIGSALLKNMPVEIVERSRRLVEGQLSSGK